MSVPTVSEPTVVDPQGNPLSTISILRNASDQMRVRVGPHSFEVLGIQNTVPDGHACVVLKYNENPVPTGAVKPEYLALTLSPHVTFRVDGTVYNIREHHPAMENAMMLEQTADGGLKWVPLLIVERYESPNGKMITAWFGELSSPSSIDIAI